MNSVLLLRDETYSNVQLSTYIMANEGDIYYLPGDFFQQFAVNGAFAALEDYSEVMETLDRLGIDAEKGWRLNTETMERHLVGIPASSLPGMAAYGFNTENCWFSVLLGGGNLDNTVHFLCLMLEDMATAPAPAN